MNRILITGATGNVGVEVIKALHKRAPDATVYAGVREIGSDGWLQQYGATPVLFDFENPAIYQPALKNIDVLFLLRPPQLADVKKYFEPLILQAKQAGVMHIVFLSVQGAEANRFIPHHKIEAAIRASGLAYTFLRPAYFMQNFTTTLRNDLVQKRLIFLPAGKARFTLVDVTDIGDVAACIMREPETHAGKAYDLTAAESYTFAEMAGVLSNILQTNIRYISPNLLRFYRAKRKEGQSTAFILVLIMLHFLPRFQKTPPISESIQQITGHAPASFPEFVARNKANLLS